MEVTLAEHAGIAKTSKRGGCGKAKNPLYRKLVVSIQFSASKLIRHTI